MPETSPQKALRLAEDYHEKAAVALAAVREARAASQALSGYVTTAPDGLSANICALATVADTAREDLLEFEENAAMIAEDADFGVGVVKAAIGAADRRGREKGGGDGG